MAAKVTFDPVNRLIIIKEGETEIDTKTDLYSDAKEDWKEDATLNKLRLPFRTIAGDPLPGGLIAGAYFFLQNQAGWRIRPDEADHELIIKGNLYPEDETLPMFVPTLGGYIVSISLERSSLTQVPDLSGIAVEVWDEESRGSKLDDLDVKTALEDTLTQIKGSGWTVETLKLLKELMDKLEAEVKAPRASFHI